MTKKASILVFSNLFEQRSHQHLLAGYFWGEVSKTCAFLGKHTTSKFEVLIQGQPLWVLSHQNCKVGNLIEFAKLLVEAQDVSFFKKTEICVEQTNKTKLVEWPQILMQKNRDQKYTHCKQ